ncbi:MAG: hypothetical protein JXQ72_07350 [Anaerolineae bacterium]|nr:hypothetical protein [Anaerolineae bacterium]
MLTGVTNAPNILVGAHLAPAIENEPVIQMLRASVMARLIGYLQTGQ